MTAIYTTKTDNVDVVYAADVNELQAGIGFAPIPGGRLTLETGVPLSTSDQSAKATLYYTAYHSDRIGLYNGTAWEWLSFSSDLSITLVGTTASTPYDVFCYNNSGTATLELLAWTNATTRATALARQDGRLVKSGAATRLYLGTIYINATGGQTDDALSKRFVWNMYNRIMRNIQMFNTTNSWTYTGVDTVREINGGTGQTRAEFVYGQTFPRFRFVHSHAFSTASAESMVGISIDSTSAFNLWSTRKNASGVVVYDRSEGVTTQGYSAGYHYVTQVENTTAGATLTNYGATYTIRSNVFLDF